MSNENFLKWFSYGLGAVCAVTAIVLFARESEYVGASVIVSINFFVLGAYFSTPD